MDAPRIHEVMRALDGALAVFQEAKGRRAAADIRVQSMISAARLVLAQRLEENRRMVDEPLRKPAIRSPGSR